MNRRQFVVAASAACACLLCPLEAGAARRAGPVEVGTLKDFAQSTVTDKWSKSHGFFIIRHDKRLYAPSAFCTHRNSVRLVSRPANGPLLCPSHGSRFDEAGVVTRGPARRSLPRYAIRVNADGGVVVDTSRKFEEGQWDDPDSFIEIPGSEG